MPQQGSLIAMLVVAMASGACGSDEVTTSAPHAEPRMRRLLAKQYVNSVRALLGPAAAAVAKPPPDVANLGFESIGATDLTPGEPALVAYEQSAQAIANSIVADITRAQAVMGCTPASAADAGCYESFVRDFGRRAFRRTLGVEEVARYVDLATATATRYQNAYAGTAYVLMAFLQSPYFLYQVEVGEVDPEDKSRRRLTGVEIATRLAYFLTDAPPDRDLLDLGESNQLGTPEAVRAKARELLERPEARDALDNYYEERFKLRGVAGLSKDVATFPQFNAALGPSMRQEALLLLRDVVWTRNADYRELLTAPYAFVNTQLAQLYGTMPVLGDGFERRLLPPTRQGVFGQGAFLAREAHPDSTSPTRRGRFVSERVLCIDIPPPPASVVAVLPPPVPGNPQTMRERLVEHSANEVCASCHARMDGIGLALENFDGIGAYRIYDNGFLIDPTGDIFEVSGFTGITGLGALVREMPELHRCWSRSLYRHATGHLETEGDERALLEVDEKFAASEYRLQELLVEIAASDAFRYVANPEAK